MRPPLFFAAAYWFQERGLHGILMVTFTWDIWHVLMQHYGFMRIYDAKQKEISPLTARLDWIFSISSYVALIVASPHYRNNLLYLAYQSGIPVLPMGLFEFLKNVIYAVAILSAIVYVGYSIYLWRQGRHNIRKLVTLALFLGATYYLYIYSHDFVVGFAVWSGFHCLQYYGIVWAFNRSRVERGGDVTRFVRVRLSAKGRSRGFLRLVDLRVRGTRFHPAESPRRQHDQGASHFVRCDVHGLALLLRWLHLEDAGAGHAGTARHRRREHRVDPVVRAATASLVGAAVAQLQEGLVPGRLRNSRDPSRRGARDSGVRTTGLTMHRNLATLASGSEEAHLRLGEALRVRGQLPEALGAYQNAVELNPEFAKAHVMMGVTMAGLGDVSGAAEAYREAIKLQPDDATAHFNLAGVLESQGQIDQALHHYQRATQGSDAQAERLAREAVMRLQSQR